MALRYARQGVSTAQRVYIATGQQRFQGVPERLGYFAGYRYGARALQRHHRLLRLGAENAVNLDGKASTAQRKLQRAHQ